jgi:hypothetical protein
MKGSNRAHGIGAVLYSLPFLVVIGISVFVVWAGDAEMIAAGVALLPVVLYFAGARKCRYVIGVFSAISFVIASMIPFVRSTEGRYFWAIWTPIWVVFALSTFLSFVPDRSRQHEPGKPVDAGG